MNRKIALTTGMTGLLLAAGPLIAVPASADTPSPSPTTIVVTWLAPGGPDHIWTPRQQYVSAVGDCGYYQQDTYRYATPTDQATVAALIAQGTLGLDKNFQPEDASVWIKSVRIDKGVCVTPTPTTTESAPVPSPSSSTPDVTLPTTPPTTADPSPSTSVPVVVPPVATPSTTPNAAVLPHTGGPGLAVPIAGFAAILAGAGALILSRKRAS